MYVTEDMERFAGEVVTIEGIGENGRCGIEEDRGVGIWHLSMFEGLAGDEQTEETVKLYTWQDLCDYEILLHEKWRIANEQRMEQGQELSVMHTLRQEYMKDIKRIMTKLGREVPADRAKELGFEV